jgi:hypothetical protein
MLKAIFFCIGLLAFGCSQSDSEGIELKRPYKSFLPENDYHLIDPNPRGYGGITEQEFHAVLDRVERIYRPIIASFGANLKVERNWKSNTVNAYAQQTGKNWIISFYGGLARHEEVTPEGFALVVCHELGHHVAGVPEYPDSSWASNEGNSDFYSTASCARKVFAITQDDNDDTDQTGPCGFITPNEAENISGTACGERRFMTANDKTVCERSLAGGLSLGKLLASLGNENEPSYETPDRTVVRETQHSHPAAQCRLDTYKAGTACLKSWNDRIIPKTQDDFMRNSCTTRPRCWFAGLN